MNFDMPQHPTQLISMPPVILYYPKKQYKIALALFLVALWSCGGQTKQAEAPNHTPTLLFSRLTPEESGIGFENKLIESPEANYYQYMYTYIGGGVAVADFDNDGLEDLFFTANMQPNKLYHNKGGLHFEDITEKAGIQHTKGFDTGVTIADVNNDGLLDIYICRGGWQDEAGQFANLLYINNGGLSFTEKAKEYGLADENRGIQAVFFDYDRDNDLDVYIANTPDVTSRTRVVDLKAVASDPATLERKGADKLYNNDGQGHFTDVSEQSGIWPDIGFGLNPQVGDLNGDGWLDVYVCNDFNMPDMAYLNNGNGTFSEARDALFKHMSYNSMGSDLADLDNDGRLDLVTLDMSPEDYVRSKTTMAMTSISLFERMVAQGYHYQYMHNMLQHNNGNGTFSEVGQMAGIAHTDWSWAVLAADFDLDGHSDLYITNGVYRDVIDRDQNNAIMGMLRQKGRKPTAEDFLHYAQMLPQEKLNNYLFKNQGGMAFQNVSEKWAEVNPTFSNGATYADLDNDGDLELIVNNLNDPATVLKNNAVELGMGQYLQVKLEGAPGNHTGLGTTACLHLSDGTSQTRQLMHTRGFLSSVSGKLHFGLSSGVTPKSLDIVWPDGKVQTQPVVAPNQLVKVAYRDAHSPSMIKDTTNGKVPLFTRRDSPYRHIDPASPDYEVQLLLPHKLSQTGPALTRADVNGDGLDDLYLGGGHRQAGQLLLGQPDGSLLRAQPVAAFERDKMREDTGACFFDADNDGDQDLYVASGSYEFSQKPKLLQDRLYLNDGQGRFSRTTQWLPDMPTASAAVVPCDFDQDGDIDLFVGGRVVPGRYPYAPQSYLLRNEGGRFSASSAMIAPALQQVGMVTDAAWADLDADGDQDLVVTGEWMGMMVFENQDNKLIQTDKYKALSEMTGWWNRIIIADVDKDGNLDIITGNLGLNYKFRASVKKPFHIYTHDFDYNGVEDIMLAKHHGNKQVPVRGRACTAAQMPHLAQKIPTYMAFAQSGLKEIIGSKIGQALHYQVVEFRSGIFYQKQAGQFVFEPFAMAAQQAPINSLLWEDMDGDGHKDLLMAGNNYLAEIETTRADAGIGIMLKGKGQGGFIPQSHLNTGFFANGDVRQMCLINTIDGMAVALANNNGPLTLFVQHTSRYGGKKRTEIP